MKYGMYSLYDRVSKVYGHPAYFVNDDVCIRSIRIAASQPGDLRNTLPDLEVVKVGNYDDSTGLVVPADRPELIIRGDSFFEVKNNGE